MANVIPGTDALGSGFNIFGTFSTDSLKRPLFDFSQMGPNPFTSPANNTYDVPANVWVNSTQVSYTPSYSVFTSKQDFLQQLTAKSNVKGSYCAFSAEFDVNYDSISQGESDLMYGLVETEVQTWAIELINQTRSALLPSVTADPDFANVPDTFTPDNEYLFFRFFQKFGTHYVDQVVLGGSLRYCTTNETSFLSDVTAVRARLEAEYKGTFVDVHGSASADWKVADKKWMANRRVSIRAVGGTVDEIGEVDPQSGTSFNAVYTDWLHSTLLNPAEVSFRLQPIYALFSGDQAAALQEAAAWYANQRVYVEARTEASTVIVAGAVQAPDPLPVTSPPPSGYQAAILDRSSLDVVFSKQYGLTDYGAQRETMYGQIVEDLQGFASQPQYVVALASFNMFSLAYPTPAFTAMLKSCGAGAKLDGWDKTGTPKQSYRYVNYALLGVGGSGPGTGIEALNEATPEEADAKEPLPLVTVSGMLIEVNRNGSNQLVLVPA